MDDRGRLAGGWRLHGPLIPRSRGRESALTCSGECRRQRRLTTAATKEHSWTKSSF